MPQVFPRRADHALSNRPDVCGHGCVLFCLVLHLLQQEFMSQRHVQLDCWCLDVRLVLVPVLGVRHEEICGEVTHPVVQTIRPEEAGLNFFVNSVHTRPILDCVVVYYIFRVVSVQHILFCTLLHSALGFVRYFLYLYNVTPKCCFGLSTIIISAL